MTAEPANEDDNSCPLCRRPVPAELQTRHHLIPRLKGGTNGPIALLCSSCHSKIHSVLSESELARSFNTIEALRDHPEIRRFAAWLSSKPPSFHAGSRSLRRTRRRPGRS